MAKRKLQRKIYRKNTNAFNLPKSRLRKFKALSILEFLFYGLISGFLVFLILFFHYGKDLPRPEKFTEKQETIPTTIYDRTGETLLYTIFGEEKREIVKLDQMPDNIKNAVIAVEDANFYKHHGIDPKGILRAIISNLKSKKFIKGQGASTISQQLIRSTFLTPEKTIKRKIREIILSLELDRRYPKDQILEWYLNQVPFGSNAYGIESASQTFFSKKTKDLDLVESALLASLIQMPSYLSPYGNHLDELLERKDYVIDRMRQEGFISEQEAESAKKQELLFNKTLTSLKAPHFVISVKKEIIEKYGEEYLVQKGLKVFTTLNVELQELAEQAIKKGAERNRNFRAYNAALTAIDPKTGEVLALVGSVDYFAEPLPVGCISGKDCLFEPEFDVVRLGERQPGSSFKPIVYATAFQKGYDDKYTVIDEETNFGIWGGKPYIPKNYDGQFRGEVTLRQALSQSLNIPAVKVLVDLAGIEDSVNMAKNLGITTLKDPSFYGPSLVLGGGEVKLIEIVSAFGVFANQGLKNKTVTILKIEDNQGNIIEEHKSNPKRVLSSEAAKLITDILSDNESRTPMFGKNSLLNIQGVSSKTGTTQYYNDAWTIGYNSNITAGVWAGNNDNSPNNNQPGVVLAGPIWNEFMVQAIKIMK
ncbi:MAG: PBP1A family penicillin-binding protein [Candidatus Pacebacteria bacterium]|nr:PBP1A family penicillin-binding protein [Candidatus Paceibacterota bacterium]